MEEIRLPSGAKLSLDTKLFNLEAEYKKLYVEMMACQCLDGARLVLNKLLVIEQLKGLSCKPTDKKEQESTIRFVCSNCKQKNTKALWGSPVLIYIETGLDWHYVCPHCHFANSENKIVKINEYGD